MADQNIHEFTAMNIAVLSAFQEKCFRENEIKMPKMNSLNWIAYFTIFISLNNDRLSISLKFITIEFIPLYTFIREFIESYSFSSARNGSSLSRQRVNLLSLRKEDKPNGRLPREKLQISWVIIKLFLLMITGNPLSSAFTLRVLWWCVLKKTLFQKVQSISTLSMNLRDIDVLLEPLQETFL